MNDPGNEFLHVRNFKKEHDKTNAVLNDSAAFLTKMRRLIADYNEFNKRAKDYLNKSSMPKL